ncbi:MocR-like pyridoxine biosynthesis transcription factor PdxR [Thermoflavimicrobium dichotomicum]|uniref:DNA-binding transcriptional regulator, MocR family, contains an aminotransferase domain n=1 Tax=Thermoflavimicrobium dichotomicum TaxID=46223 RepID=A0A1I3KFG8_9BACL|nr:PLP-dependent aminotransferase family protein [Thermoflavimicrobium dichotomicum]SFI71080.1 DNA-binding transcriptional regulator, MocR family, contains an aminotransferase domain [Thermoflavimicrobium dichotomicum]
MKIELNRQSQIPLAQQIFQAFADRILSGYFPSGSRLPSVRKLARTLQVSPVTVIQAFDLLEKQQLIERIQGKGTFVTNRSFGEKEEESKEEKTLLQIPDYLHRTQQMYYNQTPARINFSSPIVHPDLLPTNILAESIQQLVQREPEILAQYGEIQGDIELRQALATYLVGEEIKVSPQDILVTNGSQQGIDLVARCFLGPGDIVVTEQPTYPAAIDIFRSRGATVISVPMDEEGMRMDKLTALFDTYNPKLIYTIPTFQNPTGYILSQKRRRELIELAYHMNCLILEDDPWSEIYFDESPPLHIKAMDHYGNVIYLKGLSKILSPGCRIGFLVASEGILNRLIAAKTNADMGNPLLNQKVILPIFQTKLINRLLKELRETLKQKRNMTIHLLNKHAPSGVSWILPKGGFNIWITLPKGTNSIDLLSFMKQKEISFLPGSACYPSEIEWNHLRLSFSNVSENELSYGIKEMCLVIREYLHALHQQRGQTPLF